MDKSTLTCGIKGTQLHINFAAQDWVLDYSGDLEVLWSQMNEADLADERIPYWVELWPSSLALARWLRSRQQEISGRTCLDLGCGLGFTTLVGQFLGANVIGCDYTLQALQTARQNATLNHLIPQWVAMDWRNPALKSHSVWRVWAGDILYERRSIRPVLDFLRWCLAPGGAAWIAEPGRSIFGHFVELAHQKQWRLEQVFEDHIPGIKPGEANTHVIIWEAHPPVTSEN